jgi:hypothetical protein
MGSTTRPGRVRYVHHSFLPLPDSPYRLFRRMNDIEALFK